MWSTTLAGAVRKRFQDPPRLLWPAGVLLVLAAYVLLAVFPVRSDDIFMYLALGRAFFRDGKLPDVDPFLYSIPNHPWNILFEWGSYLLAFKIFDLGGWGGLIAVKTLLVVAAGTLPLVLAARLGYRSVLVPALTLLAGFAAADRFIERSSLTSDVLTALVLAVVLAERKKPGRAVLFLPVLFLLWVNLHPGFLAGLAVSGLSLASNLPRFRERGFRTQAVSLLASSAACLANPRGLAGALFPLRAAADLAVNPALDVVRKNYYEFQPTLSAAYRATNGVLAFLALVAAVGFLLLLAWAAGRRPFFETLVFALLVWQGFSAIRFVSLAAFSLAVLGAALAAPTGWLSPAAPPAKEPKEGRRQKRRRPDSGPRAQPMAVAVLALMAAVVVKLALGGSSSFSGPRRLGVGLEERAYPVRSAEFLDTIGLRTNLFNQHDFGSYLAWTWDGRRKLFYHGFCDDPRFYDREYLAVNRSPADFDRVVNEFNIGAFLLTRPAGPPAPVPLLYQLLLTRPEWHFVFSDAASVVFLRDLPENRDAILRYGRQQVRPGGTFPPGPR